MDSNSCKNNHAVPVPNKLCDEGDKDFFYSAVKRCEHLSSILQQQADYI